MSCDSLARFFGLYFMFRMQVEHKGLNGDAFASTPCVYIF